MAISTNAAIDFFGTQDTVTVAGGTSAVSNDAFSASGDVVSGGWTNDDDAPDGTAVLTFQYPSGTISTDGVNLVVRRMNIDGTADEAQPDSGYAGLSLGTFPIDANLAATTNTTTVLDIPLLNAYSSQVYEFYLENKLNVTMTAGWTLKITPKTLGPHA